MRHRTLIYLVAVIIISVLLPVIVTAQNAPDSTDIQRQVVRRIRERLNPRWFWEPLRLSVNGEGVISGLAGRGLNINLTSTDPLDRAYEFFERYGALFQIEDPRQELFLEGVPIDSMGHQEHPAITGGVLFEQRVNLIKVRYAGMVVYISRDTDSTFAVDIQSTYQPQARNVDTTPTITEERAMEIAKDYPANGNGYLVSEPHGIEIIQTGDTYHLAWRVGVGGGIHKGDAFFFVDAHTGEILRTEAAWRE